MSQSPIFVKTYDMLLWLIPKTLKFPREQRFIMARQVQESAFQFQSYLIESASLPSENRRDKLALLHKADAELTKLRLHLRLCHDLGLLEASSHHHVSLLVDEVGRLLGGWLKSAGGKSTPESGI